MWEPRWHLLPLVYIYPSLLCVVDMCLGWNLRQESYWFLVRLGKGCNQRIWYVFAFFFFWFLFYYEVFMGYLSVILVGKQNLCLLCLIWNTNIIIVQPFGQVGDTSNHEFPHPPKKRYIAIIKTFTLTVPTLMHSFPFMHTEISQPFFFSFFWWNFKLRHPFHVSEPIFIYFQFLRFFFLVFFFYKKDLTLNPTPTLHKQL